MVEMEQAGVGFALGDTTACQRAVHRLQAMLDLQHVAHHQRSEHSHCLSTIVSAGNLLKQRTGRELSGDKQSGVG